jgi:oligopeptide transport system substrate-binding protein
LHVAADETESGARAQTLAEAERRPLAEEPAVPVLFYESKNMVSKRVKGWRDNLLDRHLARCLSIEPPEADRGNASRRRQ